MPRLDPLLLWLLVVVVGVVDYYYLLLEEINSRSDHTIHRLETTSRNNSNTLYYQVP